ncbi:DUF4437 domain-containing protein [Novosphingobium sp. FSY-8]|uniref:DUF4437 domain-containing protein n=1 Tax=Novosphingobium ovatum TaxID=1908523 RepID=A0ABW9XBX2_9SPHN|nr:DUF4437 domain-containing protein [Novosphingobium ovatum]NBC36025.1 DUF4437 domain-containing protein [Novosphingobium ovatum]
MARPHIEFVQTQNVPWAQHPDGTATKLLNGDPDTGAQTLIVRYPAGFTAGGVLDRGEELFVLEGALTLGEQALGWHAYAFAPRGGSAVRGSVTGATVLIFRHGWACADSVAGVAEPVAIDTPRMAWDTSTYDPALSHLRLARKVLRLGPNDSGRTFLLTGLPHGIPPETHLRPEMHTHAEEMFMLSGSMWAPEGLMCAGAYFYRPPGIIHGPHVSPAGFLQIMRSPGANRIVTHWQDRLEPLPIGAPYAPRGVPPEWAAPYAEGAAC